MTKLYIIVPCYNEQEVLADTTAKLTEKLKRMIAGGIVSDSSAIVYVDDGSKDETWNIIESCCRQSKYIRGIKLLGNKGHQNALIAGLLTVKDDCDATISMDADLQDDIEVLDDFIAEYKKGNDVVYGVRKRRDTDTAFKRGTAQSYYKLLNFFGVNVRYNAADYRLMSSKALNVLGEYKEVNLFLRGIVPLMDLKSSQVEYDRKERKAGTSKYTIGKMLGLAFNGITSFSLKPIRMITGIGFIIFLISIVMIIYAFVSKATGNVVDGWTSIMLSIWAIGGIELMAIGIVGEYVGKSYMETKKRPRFIIEKTVGIEKKDDNK